LIKAEKLKEQSGGKHQGGQGEVQTEPPTTGGGRWLMGVKNYWGGRGEKKQARGENERPLKGTAIASPPTHRKKGKTIKRPKKDIKGRKGERVERVNGWGRAG